MRLAALRLNPALDVPALAAAFARDRRVAVADFLAADAADALEAHLRARADWRLLFNAGARTYELPRHDRRAMAPAEWTKLAAALDEAGHMAFQYRYEGIRVSDVPVERAASGTLLDRFAELMAAPETLALLRAITGDRALAFADAQGTCYTAGDFLTAHDDAVAGKSRRAAYVYGLSRVWRAEWGGLLLFHGQEGRIVEGYVPGFNMLHLFAVPSAHSVSSVAPLAGPAERLSITGWLREAVD